MPWTAETFKKHNKKLSPAAAARAAKQANAILASGADEGTAIATANKHAEKWQRGSRESRAEQMYNHPRSG